MRPLEILESESFKEFINALDFRYTLPSRKSMRDKYFVEQYNFKKKIIIEDLKKSDGISLTYDYWSGKNGKNYLSATIQFINEEFQLKNYTLQAIECEEKHTSNNTSK